MADLYRDLRPHLRSGDLVLFSGTSAFSRAIKVLTRSRWSHVGLVVCQDDRVLVWESAGDGVALASLDDQFPEVAPQLSHLSLALSQPGGAVSVRLLNGPRGDAFDKALWTFVRAHVGKPYETSKLELLKALFGGLFDQWVPENAASYFCSELVGATLKAVGVLDPRVDANSLTPKDFAEGTVLPLLGDYRYGDEHPLRVAPVDTRSSIEVRNG